MKKKLRLSVLFDLLRKTASSFPDCRTGKNIQYSPEEFLMTAFSAFFIQSPSFNSHKNMSGDILANGNAKSVFDLDRMPCHNRLRNFFDKVSPDYLNPVYDGVFRNLDRSGVLSGLRGFRKDILIPLDGTDYFSSKKVFCQNCSVANHGDGTKTYRHSVLMPAIVVPNGATAVPLSPEFIKPQDGAEKQDCEINAAKRWVNRFRKTHKKISATVLGDDLYSRQPFCRELLNNRLNFILVCKPGSHTTLYNDIDELEKKGGLSAKRVRRIKDRRHETDIYRYGYDVRLRNGDDALRVNWAEMTTVNEHNEIIYKNSFITNHGISEKNIEAVVAAGRSRWKIENEGINTLKNQGYNLTHNYGHGGKFLSSFLASLILIAFLFHTVLDITGKKYGMLRCILSSRKELFSDIRSLIKYICFDSLQDLFDFMLKRLKGRSPPA